MSSICSRPLPESYIEQLKSMSLFEIAAEAANQRADRSVGCATKRIISWVRHRQDVSDEQFHAFLRVYAAFWHATQTARKEGLTTRPQNRPVKSNYHQRSPRRERTPAYV